MGLLLAALALFAGCAISPNPAERWAAAEAAAGEVRAFDAETGRAVSFDDLVTRAAGADVIVFAETHDDETGQAHAVQLVQAVLERTAGSRSPALALEFLERDAQVVVDDYLTGITDRPGLDVALAASDRIDQVALQSISGSTIDPEKLPESHLPLGHLQAIAAAREAGATVIAANAPRRYVRFLRRHQAEGFKMLTTAQRRLVERPEPLSGGDYRDRFYGLMEGMGAHHGSSSMNVDALYYAQNIWDATMADSVAEALREGRRPVMLIVGQFHADFGGGVIERIRKNRPGARVFTISYQPVPSSALREEDEDRADVVVYTARPQPTS